MKKASVVLGSLTLIAAAICIATDDRRLDPEDFAGIVTAGEIQERQGLVTDRSELGDRHTFHGGRTREAQQTARLR